MSKSRNQNLNHALEYAKQSAKKKPTHGLDFFINGTIRGTILDKAVAEIEKSGIDFDLLMKYQIKIFNGTKSDLGSRLGFTKIGNHDLLDGVSKLIEFPYYDNGKLSDYYAYKTVPTLEDSDGKQRKYLLPKGKEAIPYIVPEVWEVKDKVTKPLWITEGCKKALKLLQHSRLSISITGVWAFKTKVWDLFKWRGRTVYLSFDSDYQTNPNVRMALYELAFKLHAKGAILKIATWPKAEGKGIDDFLFVQRNAERSLDDIEEEADGLMDFIIPDHHKEIVRALTLSKLSGSSEESTYQQISEKLRITVDQLKKDVNSYRKEFNPTYPYYIDKKSGCLFKEKVTNTRNSEKIERVKLANFDARIVKDIKRSDGVEEQRIYVIKGKTKDFNFPHIEVPAKIFNSLIWLEKWGSKAVVSPGNNLKEFVRYYIQMNLSKETVCLSQYSHTGWIMLDDEWIYLTKDGAIGRKDVSVILSKENQRYNLPVKKVSEEREKKAIKRSLSFLDVAVPDITYPLFALAHISPLTTILEQPPNFVMFLFGRTGHYKSTLATLAMKYFGNFSITQLPNFSDTANAIEKRTSDLKDSLMTIDDYHPTANRFESLTKESILQRLIRAVSNRTGRTRLKQDASERGAYNPRGMVLITGEALAQVESTLARVMIVEIKKKEDINLEKLTKLQKYPKRLLRSMASYIDWLRPQIKEIQDRFKNRFPELRKEYQQDGCHPKSSEQMAYLTFALEVVFEWMIEKKVITEKQSKKMLEESKTVFNSAIKKHTILLKTENPTSKYIEILSTLITQGKVYLKAKTDPENDYICLGGELISGGRGSDRIIGAHIGYHDDKYIYLFPKGTYKEIVSFSSSSGTHFSTGERTILKMLKDAGILKPRGGSNTYTLNNMEGGTNPTVMRLRREKNPKKALLLKLRSAKSAIELIMITGKKAVILMLLKP